MRRVFMWIAFGSFIEVALVYAVTTVLRILFLRSPVIGAPYSPGGFTSSIYSVITGLGLLQGASVPIAAVSAAIYMVLLDRDFRARTQPKGFQVELLRPTAGQ